MRKFFLLFGVICLPALLSSCFEIREKMKINRDGSGSYAMEMDFSESKNLFQMLLQMANNETGLKAGLDGNPLEGLDVAFDELSVQLNELEGISKATGIKDMDNFRFGITLNFASVEALNLALSQMDASGESISYRPYYMYSKGKLEKSNLFNLRNLASEIKPNGNNAQIDPSLQDQLQELYNEVTYTLIIQSDREVKKYDNKDAVLSADKSTLTFTKKLRDLEGANVSNVIRFK
jgi:hypothetical protein